MKLWILTTVEGLGAIESSWEPWYDRAFGHIVRANTEDEARELAANECGDESSDAWLDPNMSTCHELLEGGRAGVIMTDFHAA